MFVSSLKIPRSSRLLITIVALILIGIFGSLFRLYNISYLPSELHRDELAISYNAYSLIETTRDEHGAGPWPLLFQSFGDFKLPGLIYATVPAIKLFGLTPFATRLPTVIFSILLILVTFFFTKELSNSYLKGVVAAATLAISQWHIFLSRTAYEPIAGLTLHITALFFLLKARQQPSWYWLSLPTFGLAFFTYNVPLLLLPFIIILYLVCFVRKSDRHIKAHVTSLTVLATFFFVILVTLSLVTVAKSKTTILAHPMLEAELQREKDNAFLGGMPNGLRVAVTNKYYSFLIHFARRYVGSFNPDYLFFSGGSNSWHSLVHINLGSFSLIWLPFLLLGGAYVIRKSTRGSREYLFLLGFLLITPIPDAFTIDAPVTNRLMDFHFALSVVSSLGLANFLDFLGTKRFAIFGYLATSVLFTYFFVVFAGRYFFLHSRTLSSSWHEGFRSLAQKLPTYERQYKTIIIDPSSIPGAFEELIAPYIYVAYYTKYSPQLLQQHATRVEKGGFSIISEMKPYQFKSLSKDDLSNQPILYISRYPEPPDSLIKEVWAIELFKIRDVHGEVVWTGYQVQSLPTNPEK